MKFYILTSVWVFFGGVAVRVQILFILKDRVPSTYCTTDTHTSLIFFQFLLFTEDIMKQRHAQS